MTTPPALPSGIENEVPVRGGLDVIHARSLARQIARELGFSRPEQGRIAIAVSELAGNIVKFAGSGLIVLTRLGGDRPGIEVRAIDHGPGIADVARAVEDGFSEGRYLDPEDPQLPRRGLGCGLSAVKRLMDSLEVVSRPQGGTAITAAKYLRPLPQSNPPLAVSNS